VPLDESLNPLPFHQNAWGRIEDPRLRAGRARIQRHAWLRGFLTGLAIGLPVAVVLWNFEPRADRALFKAAGVLVILGGFFAALQYRLVRSRWPRIWDATTADDALVETIVCQWHLPAGDPWRDSMRARCAQIPLPPLSRLQQLAPMPSPWPSLLLALLALWVTAPSPSPPATAPQQLGDVAPPRDSENPREHLRGREDAARALAGRDSLKNLAEQLRGSAAAPETPGGLLPRDLEALQNALSRLDDSDPLRDSVERWIPSQRPDGQVDEQMTVLPIEDASEAGEAVAQQLIPGSTASSTAAEIADGGLDAAVDLEPVTEESSSTSDETPSIRIDGGIEIGSMAENLETIAPLSGNSTASWDRVRDDPRLQPRWKRVIDLYLDSLDRKEPAGGR